MTSQNMTTCVYVCVCGGGECVRACVCVCVCVCVYCEQKMEEGGREGRERVTVEMNGVHRVALAMLTSVTDRLTLCFGPNCFHY